MSDCIETPVFFVRTVEVEPEQFDCLYGEIATFMQEECAKLSGFIDGQLFGSTDSMRIMIAAQWSSQKAWSRAQWDWRLGQLIEEIVLSAQTVDLNLYRREYFPAAAPA